MKAQLKSAISRINGLEANAVVKNNQLARITAERDEWNEEAFHLCDVVADL